jgi:hypothetical protein
VLVPEHVEILAQDAPAGVADDVADQEEIHGFGGAVGA